MFYMVLTLILQGDDLNKLLNYFFDLSNPVLYSLFISLLIFLIITLFYRRNVIPFEERFVQERKSIESRYRKELVAMMELNPDPLLRINNKGEITYYNNAAGEIFSELENKETKFNTLFPQNEVDIETVFETSIPFGFSVFNRERYYYGRIWGNKNENFAMVHLHDTTAYFRYEKEYFDMIDKVREHQLHSIDRMESEKKRIASELHDSVGQIFSAAKLHIGRLEGASDFSRVEDVYQKSMDLLGSGIQELKDITFRLRPRILEEMGLAAAIESLVSRVLADEILNGSFDYYGSFFMIESRIEIALYRIAQETISNIVKHSQATNFSVQLVNNGSFIRLLINDNGIGFDLEKILTHERFRKSLGIMTIIEKVDLLKGKYKIDTAPDKGTYITIEIPIEKNNNE